MPRIRTLKPEILEDEMTAGLSDAAFRLFTGLILLADDFGNVRGESRWLEGQIWWSPRFAEPRGEPPRVAELLGELAEALLVELYEVRSQLYCHIRSWSKHQRIDNAGKPRVPGPSDGNPRTSAIRREIPRFAAGPRPPTTDPEGDPERGCRGETLPDPPALAVKPFGLSPDQRARALLNQEAWNIPRAEHEALRERFGRDKAKAWWVSPTGDALTMLVRVMDELLRGMTSQDALAVVRERTASAVAEATDRENLDWFTPGHFWKQFWSGAETTPAAIKRRVGPKSTKARDVRVGHVEPPTAEEYASDQAANGDVF